MPPVRIGVIPPVGAGVCADPEWMRPFVMHVEALGFESLCVPEHPLVIGGYSSVYPYGRSGRMPLGLDCPVPDPIDLLSFVAGCTSTLGLSTGVLVVPAHNAVTLAKRVASVDALSGGRLRIGIGVGWMREELEACGTDFETRGKRTDESIDVMRLLWADSGDEGATFDGEFFRFANAHCFPKPAQPGGIPIHVGGHTEASIRRAALRGDGWQPLGLKGEDLAQGLESLRRQAEAAGRDPDAIELTLSTAVSITTNESIEEAADIGIDRLVAASTTGELEQALDELSALADRIGLKPTTSV
ncbi:MAG: LLM class F420-dependent oxidoreductase [Acidimicrobiales bacterium]